MKTRSFRLVVPFRTLAAAMAVSILLALGAVACQQPPTGDAEAAAGSEADSTASSGAASTASSTEADDHAEPATGAAAEAGMDMDSHDHSAGDEDAAPADFESAAVRFAEELFGANTGDYGIALAPSGEEIYFTRALPDSSLEHVFVTRRDGNGWSEPEVAAFSGRYHDKEPYVSPDGNRVYFASKRPVFGGREKEDLDIWYVERRGDGWSDAVHVAAIATDKNEDYPALAADGSIAFSRSDEIGNLDLWVAWAGRRGLGEAETLGWPINTAFPEADPWFAPDGGHIIFTSPRASADAQGQGDFYVIYRDGDGWSEPASLGLHVNTIAHEYGPMFSADGSSFYFSRGFGGQVWVVPSTVLDNLHGPSRR